MSSFRDAWLLPLALATLAFPQAARATDPVHVLPGTEVSLVLSEPLSSQTAFKGQRFSLAVENDILVGGVIVIPRGAPARGLVMRAEPNGTFGKPGVLQLRIESLELGNRRIPLFYSAMTRGKDSEASAVILTAIFGPIGVLRHGKLVTVPAGTKLLAYVDQAFDVMPTIAPLTDVVTPTGGLDGNTAPPAGSSESSPGPSDQPATHDGAINVTQTSSS